MELIKVEIWSDIRCPFCYLGKRRFEKALEQFPDKEHVTVEWRSFQLDPYLVTHPALSVYDHLAEKKGISREQAVQMHEQISLQAQQLGIVYNFDKAIVANSFNAHRLSHLAKTFNVEDAIQESLFKAYFTDGINISDIDSLVMLGKELGIPGEVSQAMLQSEDFTDNILLDENYARELGINAVPFFLFNENLSVRGAQKPESFLQALLKCRDVAASPDEKAKTYFFRNL